MKQRFVMILTVSFLLGFQAGCGTDQTVYLEQISADTEQDNTADDTEEEAHGGTTHDTGLAEQQTGQVRYAAETDTSESEVCYVHVCGAVQNPGVYVLAAGSRVYEAIEMAGGMTGDASGISVNQAGSIWDGQMLFIPTVEEAASGVTGLAPDVTETGQSTGDSGNETTDADDHRVNLNTATEGELMTLPGIGASKAADILAYREMNGGFSSPEEIMQISGIKEGLYNRIKDDIKVK